MELPNCAAILGLKWHRSIKKSINPFYGKKGVGLITNPKKSLYNKIYKKTTFSIFDLFK